MSLIRNNVRISLYWQLYDILKEKILHGKYAPGEKIPSARELSETHKVSRITVEKAIEALVQENLVYRQQGKGTFVSSSKLHRNLPKLYSFSEDMWELGLEPSSRVLELRVEKADAQVRKALRLPENQLQITKLLRVRLANNEPILLETTYIPVDLCPGLTEYNFERTSLYQILDEQYHLSLGHAEEHYEITHMKPHEAEVLQCEDKTCAFSIERIAFLETDRRVEYTHAIGKGDRLHFTVKLVRHAETSFRRKIEV